MSKDTRQAHNTGDSSPTDRLAALWQARDYEGFFAEPWPLITGTLVDGRPLCQLALALARECPAELRVQHPLALLRTAHLLYGENQRAAANELMAALRDDLAAQTDPARRQALEAEWLFITALSHYPHIDRMLPPMEEAAQLAKGPVAVFDGDFPFLHCLTSPYSVFHTEPGRAEEQGELFARFTSLYERLTGGGGRGASELYQAGLCYYRGDFRQAELLCYKSIYLAETKVQAFLQLGAARILALISIHNMDLEAFSQAVDMMDRAAASRPEYGELMARTLEFERNDLYFEVFLTEHVPAWVKEDGQFIYPEVTRLYQKYAQLCYFYYSGKYARCIGLGEALLLQFPDYGVLLKATAGMLVAVSYLHLGYKDRGLELFKTYFPLLFADQLHLVFAYFYEGLDGLLDDYLAAEYPADAKTVYALMEKNREGRHLFIRTYLDKDNSLSKSERKVAILAAQGMPNKAIAEQLDLSVNTVRAHLRSIFNKLSIDRRSEIVERMK